MGGWVGAWVGWVGGWDDRDTSACVGRLHRTRGEEGWPIPARVCVRAPSIPALVEWVGAQCSRGGAGGTRVGGCVSKTNTESREAHARSGPRWDWREGGGRVFPCRSDWREGRKIEYACVSLFSLSSPEGQGPRGHGHPPGTSCTHKEYWSARNKGEGEIRKRRRGKLGCCVSCSARGGGRHRESERKGQLT